MDILTALKHLFIPHEHNDYKPHFFREISVAAIVVTSLFMLGFSAGSSFIMKETVLGVNISTAVLIDLTNESRLAYSEEPLVRNSLLDQAAQLKAEDMAAKGYFAHTSPEGVAPWHWFQKVGYVFVYAGENLAINFIDPIAVRDAWLASPRHRENLLDTKFKEIGMATVSGIYEDGPSIYVVQLFGTPAKAITVSTTTAPQNQTPTALLAVATTTKSPLPEIKGESAGSTPPEETVPPKPKYEPILNTSSVAVVRNTDEVEPLALDTVSQPYPEKYSKWYERFLFGGSYYVDMAYKVLLTVVFAALLVMILIEVRRQHWKHIAYGLSVLVILLLCIMINEIFF